MKQFFLCLLLSTSAFADQIDVIYGEDNRKDPFESADRMMVVASRSTAAMISPENLKTVGSKVEIGGNTLASRGICSKERFANQLSASTCSGFLVKNNVLVTAGHCIKDQSDCNAQKWVFGYTMGSADQAKITVNSTDVFSCKKIISRTLSQTDGNDYAVIELDRAVVGRKPLSFRTSGKIAVGTDVVVIGHPSGLPTKIADGARVRKLEGKFFVANLDTYGGNSGSAVLNAKTGAVEGILVRGENDYVASQDGESCQVSNVCPATGCRGEDVTYITNVPGLK